MLSWLALRGRCRTCSAWIGWRYPLVELAVGALWVSIVWQIASPYAGLEGSVSFSPLGLIEHLAIALRE